jgi:hypothetical protein
MKTYHLAPGDDDWELKAEDNEKPLASFDSKQQALDASIDLVRARTGSLKIHRADGTIEEERTYPRAADPVATPG